MNRDTNMNAKWLANGVKEGEKEKKLKLIIRADNAELAALYKEINRLRKEKADLLGDSATANKLSIIANEIAELKINSLSIDDIIKQIEAGKKDDSDPKTFQEIWEEQKDLQDALQIKAEGLNGDNLYSFEWKGVDYNTNEGLGAERIAYEVVHQLSKIADLNQDGTISADDKVLFKTFDDFLTTNDAEIQSNPIFANTLKKGNWKKSFKDGLRKLLASNTNLVEFVDKKDSNWEVKFHEYAGKSRQFTLTDLHSFINEVAIPSDNEAALQFISEKLGKWGDEQKWRIWTVREATDSEKKFLVERGHISEKYSQKKIYWSFDDCPNQNIEIKGLKGWTDLYKSVFNKIENKTKFENSENYLTEYDNICKKIITRAVLNGDITSLDSSNRGHLVELISKIDGKKYELNLSYNVYAYAEWLRARKAVIDTRGDSLKDSELVDQTKLDNSHLAKILKINADLEAKDKELDKLAIKRAKESQTELEKLKPNLLKKDNKTIDWKKAETILEAAKAERLILEIVWIQNGGVDGRKETKDNEGMGITAEKAKENNDLLYSIEQERIKLELDKTWHIIIKKEFESKTGSSTEEKIATMMKEKGGVGLEAVRKAYLSLEGENSATAKLIKDALDNEIKAFDSNDLTVPELNSALGITDATPDMVTEWGKIGNGWGKTKAHIESLFSLYSDNDKKAALITYLKTLGNDKINAASSEEDKFVAFKKESPAFVIEHIVRHENHEILTNDKSEARKTIVKEMQDAKLDSSYGDTKNPTSDNVFAYLRDKRINDLKRNTQEDSSTTENKSFWDEWVKPWGYRGFWIPLSVVALFSIVFFWKNISDWWNGPTGEEGETEKNQEDDE
ncbi:MAG: hypothetical protein mread185_000428 [Mycoplasmataceae bacterium]|nr:MAG: hypothetical protein mread185_000428 [Mycoplasmataceae bacterium]